jgi:sialidase-1
MVMNRSSLILVIFIAAVLVFIPVASQVVPLLQVPDSSPGVSPVVTISGDPNLIPVRIGAMHAPECYLELCTPPWNSPVWICPPEGQHIGPEDIATTGDSSPEERTEPTWGDSVLFTGVFRHGGKVNELSPEDVSEVKGNPAPFFLELPVMLSWNFAATNTSPVGKPGSPAVEAGTMTGNPVPDSQETVNETLFYYFYGIKKEAVQASESAMESMMQIDLNRKGKNGSYRQWIAAIGSASDGFAVESMMQVDVFGPGDNFGIPYHRIPAIETALDGSLIAFAEARKDIGDEGTMDQDIDLVYKRSTDNGVTWSPVQILEDPGELMAAANPVALVDRTTGRLWVFYILARAWQTSETSQPSPGDILARARWSDDNGQTWSEPINMTAVMWDSGNPAWRASIPGPGGAIQTRTGRLLVPVYGAPPAAFTIFSDDHGRTWKRGQFVPSSLADGEGQMVELADGRILMDFRQIDGPTRWLAESTDGGETWSVPWPGIRVTPVACAMEYFTLRGGGGELNSILWTGPSGIDPTDVDPCARWGLTVRMSYDEGRTFSRPLLIAAQNAGYSDLILLRDGTAGILWERGEPFQGTFITFTRLNLVLEPRAG